MKTSCSTTPIGRWWLAALIALMGGLVLPSALDAQVLYGSIVGTVTDGTGSPVPGATVTVTHTETRATRDTITDAAGAYHLPTVQSGTYTVTVSLTGFRTSSRTDVTVTLNNITRVDVPLQVGQLSETVNVSAEQAVLQTDRAEVRAELNSRELVNLPVPVGRNYQNLFKVLPGFTPPENAHSVPSNPSRALVFNVNGASRQSNNTRIDGVSTTNIWLPHVAAYVPALESLETVNVVTNSFDAEQGLAGGSAINVQIKSGTNELHGSLFEYHTNEGLRAQDYFAPPGTPKGKWRYHQFGGTAGGPIRRNRLFYFLSYEGTRDQQNVSRTVSVPTEAVRTGDLRASGTPIYDPATGAANGSGRTAFPDNIIPAGRIDAVVQRILPLIPLPNLRRADGSIAETDNYFVQAPFVFNRATLDSKVNWHAGSKLNLFGRFSVLDFLTENETVFGRDLQGQGINGASNPGTGEGNTYNFSAGATYTLTSNLVLDAHFGFVRMNSGVSQSDIGERKGLDWLGLPGTNGDQAFEGGTPFFDLDTYADFGTVDTFMPYYRNDDQYQSVLNVNWLKGGHNIRFGTDIYYQALNHTQPEISGTSFGARGGFRFRAGPTQIQGSAGNLYNAWASFLLGLPDQVGRLREVVAPYTTRTSQYSLYVRDQWQVSQKLTLSIGTRWEYFPVPSRADRGLERYNVNTNKMEIGGLGSVPMDLGVRVSKSMFAPRLGLTYRPTPTLVARAGFGITNDPYSLARPLRTNHPMVLNLVVQAPTTLTWASRLAEGIPLIADPDLQGGIIDVPGNVTVFTLPDEFERGSIRSWNVALQKELRWGFVGEAAYVGTRQIDQLGFRELNWSPINGGRTGRQLFAQFGRDAQTRLVAPVGNSQYDALQTRLERRFKDGVQMGVTYTYSKSTGIAGNDNSDGVARIQIPEFYALNEALSGFDRPHALHITNITELPFGRDRRWLNEGGILSAIVGGWQVNNIVSFYSGTPFSVTASGTSLNAPESEQRADIVVSDVRILGGIGRGNAYFDPLAFRPVTEARFGTAPFDVLRGPGYATWDLGVFRQFSLGPQTNLQFRLEAFNVTNATRFTNPGGNVSNLRLNPDGTVNNLNGFSEITSIFAGSERQIRLGIRLGF